MTRHRTPRPSAPEPRCQWQGTGRAVVVIMCEGHRVAAVVPQGERGAGAGLMSYSTDGMALERVSAPGDLVSSLARSHTGLLHRLDGVTMRTWSTRPDGPPAEIPARPLPCRRHRGGHYLDGAALRQVTDDAQRRGRQIVVNVSRVSQID